MGHHPRVSKAFQAMKALGINPQIVKPVLQKLLKLYNYKWELIEEDNYRTLADAIFEHDEEQIKEERNDDESEPSLRKPYLVHLEDQISSTTNRKRAMARIEGDRSHRTRDITLTSPKLMESSQSCLRESRIEPGSHSVFTPSTSRKGKDPISSETVHKKPKRETGAFDSNVAVGRTSLCRGEQIVKPPTSDKKKALCKMSDITNGTESVQIPLLDEIGNEHLPKFVYIPTSIIYQSAFVHISLARVADDDCCSTCIGDCLSLSVPCECARDTGGEFAYTPKGLLKEEFLEACISMNEEPQKHYNFYCDDCPLQRAKNMSSTEPCKGHLVRKFIKECWRKCGCSMQCGNRVVQRGISRKLQVYLTQNGKGWGLRAVEELPKGTFVCEYVGEILTNMELYERNKQNNGCDRHTYPVLLDADWGSEKFLKDEDALCLDATYYGNVARFINHRCFDANLIEIPVEVESPDHHYYHLAFFTKRKIAALEELTWDYGIDFDDHTHPIKAFECSCSSAFCRDKKRRESKASVPSFGRVEAPQLNSCSR